MFDRFANWAFGLRSFGLFLARGFVGLTMAFGHGYGKILDLPKFTENVANQGYPYPEVFALAAVLSELVGGVLIALGLFTRGASLFLLITMLNAAFVVHQLDPFQKKEFALLYGATFLILLFVGPGRLSLDSLIRKVPTI